MHHLSLIHRDHPVPDAAASTDAYDAGYDTVRCTHCGCVTQGRAGKSILGFRRYNCEGCGRRFDGGLHRRYRIGYWLLFAAFGAISWSEGRGPSLFVILVGMAIALDSARLWKSR